MHLALSASAALASPEHLAAAIGHSPLTKGRRCAPRPQLSQRGRSLGAPLLATASKESGRRRRFAPLSTQSAALLVSSFVSFVCECARSNLSAPRASHPTSLFLSPPLSLPSGSVESPLLIASFFLHQDGGAELQRGRGRWICLSVYMRERDRDPRDRQPTVLVACRGDQMSL